MSCNVLWYSGGGCCKLKTHFLFENYPFNHKVSPCHRDATTRHTEPLHVILSESEESKTKYTRNKKILARDVGEVTSRTYRDTRKGTVVVFLQNDDMRCHPQSSHRHSETISRHSERSEESKTKSTSTEKILRSLHSLRMTKKCNPESSPPSF